MLPPPAAVALSPRRPPCSGAGPTLAAIATLNAALKADPSSTAIELSINFVIACTASDIPGALLDALAASSCNASTGAEVPKAAVAALVGGVDIALEAGTAAVAALRRSDPPGRGDATKGQALRLALRAVGAAARVRALPALLNFFPGAPPPSQPALLNFLEEAVAALLEAEAQRASAPTAADADAEYALPFHRLQKLASEALRAGWSRALTGRPALHRGLAHLCACALRTLARQRRPGGHAPVPLHHEAAVQGLQLFHLLTFSCGSKPAPWADWASAQSAAMLVEVDPATAPAALVHGRSWGCWPICCGRGPPRGPRACLQRWWTPRRGPWPR
jgi:hypothetical protein